MAFAKGGLEMAGEDCDKNARGRCRCYHESSDGQTSPMASFVSNCPTIICINFDSD